MTKATDLKTIFLKSPYKNGIEMCHTLIFVLNNKLFFYTIRTIYRPATYPMHKKIKIYKKIL